MKVGQVVRYGDALWRVDYINECRARIVPLAKRHVILADGREFDAERGGVNISPNSPLEVVEDIERTKLEIELEETERELAALKAEAEREAKRIEALAKAEAVRQAKAIAKATPTARQGTAGLAPAGRSAMGWQLGAVPAGAVYTGLKALVIAQVTAHPGASTKAIAAGISEHSAGAVAACLDRFRKIGVVINVTSVEK